MSKQSVLWKDLPFFLFQIKEEYNHGYWYSHGALPLYPAIHQWYKTCQNNITILVVIFFSGYEMYDRVYLQILRHSYKWAYICIMLKIGHNYIEFLPGHLPRTTWNRFLCSVFLFPQVLKMTPQRSSHVKDEGGTVRPKNDLFAKMYNFSN